MCGAKIQDDGDSVCQYMQSKREERGGQDWREGRSETDSAGFGQAALEVAAAPCWAAGPWGQVSVLHQLVLRRNTSCSCAL